MPLFAPFMTGCYAAAEHFNKRSCAALQFVDGYACMSENCVISTGNDVFWKGDRVPDVTCSSSRQKVAPG